ncbi:hypothetical protein ACFPKZ_00005 [Streptosporangium amethystogenes subsp. fukuiense]|uniref:hypothetical protein n=1 Tax=Streptosporangium amethystogenes TaxID=2002 RepID=UPI003616381B
MKEENKKRSKKRKKIKKSTSPNYEKGEDRKKRGIWVREKIEENYSIKTSGQRRRTKTLTFPLLLFFSTNPIPPFPLAQPIFDGIW